MAVQHSRVHPEDMPSPEHGVRSGPLCCRGPMVTIQVTRRVDDACTLTLHTCSSCGRHVWERDGVVLERAEVLDVVQARIAEGPAARVPGPRKVRASRARVSLEAEPVVPPPPPAVPPARLAEFVVHGVPRT